MQRKTAATMRKREAPAWLIVGAIVLLVAIVGGLGYYNLRSTGPVPVQTKTSAWLEKVARESGGDYNKLSAADKARVDAIPFGGKEWLKRKYDSLR